MALKTGVNYLNYVRKTILETQSDYARSGTVAAVMSPSWASKSTLLKCISGHLSDHGGTVQLPPGNAGKKLKIALVPQN